MAIDNVLKKIEDFSFPFLLVSPWRMYEFGQSLEDWGPNYLKQTDRFTGLISFVPCPIEDSSLIYVFIIYAIWSFF